MLLVLLWFDPTEETAVRLKKLLLMFPSVQVLVLGNKRDLPHALDEKQLIEKM